jgi:hypothetical protein
LWDSIWYENGMTERKNTQLPSDSEAALDRTRATDEERLKLRYAFVVTIVALSTLIAILLIGARKWSNAKDAAAVISPIAGVVGTIVGAAGRERAAAEHREQTRIAQQLAAVADPAPAARILGIDLDAESRGGSDAQSERQ